MLIPTEDADVALRWPPGDCSNLGKVVVRVLGLRRGCFIKVPLALLVVGTFEIW